MTEGPGRRRGLGRRPGPGGVETLVSTPFNSSHFSLTPEERRAARIDDGMIRLSVGLEDADELIADLAGALEGTR